MTMRFSNRDLAQTLLMAVQQHPSSVKQICEDFIEFLRINRRLKSLPLIVQNLETAADREFGIKRVRVTSRFPLQTQAIKAIERLVMKRTGAAKLIIDHEINEQLIGGAAIKFDDTVIDLSLQTQFDKFVA